MIRLAAAVLALGAAAFPVALLPTPPVTWVATLALGLGGAGVAALSVPVATAGAVTALIAYSLALVIARPAADPLAALALGSALVLLPVLVHLAGRLRGAAVGAGVLPAQLRQGAGVAAAGILAGLALTVAGAGLGPVLLGTTLPLAVLAAAVGVLLAVAGAVALLTPRD